MAFQYTKARREKLNIMLAFAGASQSGKTWSAMIAASALSGGLPFAFGDTERRRALHYSDDFDFEHFPIEPPFHPAKFLEFAQKAEKRGFRAAVIDSASHEWSGIGGVRWMADRDNKKPPGNWIKPKAEHQKMLDGLLQTDIHLILCLRAKEKIKIVPDPANPNKTVVIPMGWMPICERDLMYEVTLSFTLTPDRPGMIHDDLPGKCPDKFRPQFPPGTLISHEAGRNLAEWADGGELPWPRELLARAMNAAHQGTVRFRDFSHSEVTADERPLLTPYRRKLIEAAREADANQASMMERPAETETASRPSADDYPERYEEDDGTDDEGIIGDEGAMPALDGENAP